MKRKWNEQRFLLTAKNVGFVTFMLWSFLSLSLLNISPHNIFGWKLADMVLTAGPVILLVELIVFLGVYAQIRKKALLDVLQTEQCLLCDSTKIIERGENNYRCTECGYDSLRADHPNVQKMMPVYLDLKNSLTYLEESLEHLHCSKIDSFMHFLGRRQSVESDKQESIKDANRSVMRALECISSASQAYPNLFETLSTSSKFDGKKIQLTDILVLDVFTSGQSNQQIQMSKNEITTCHDIIKQLANALEARIQTQLLKLSF